MLEYLNERSVSLLEEHWSELPTEAYCEATPEGWKIHLLDKAKVFAEAGIHDEQWVNPSELLNYAAASGQRALVERLLAILEHIKK